MDSTRMQKIENALRNACASDVAIVRLENAGSDPVGGQVLSSRFDSMRPSERQDLIGARLDVDLTPLEARRISFIVADTPAERGVLGAAHAV